MLCNFSYRHYREILNRVLKQGYNFCDFQSSGLGGEAPTLYLRHDIDADIIGAVELAQIEYKLGIIATYFIMPDSVVYNPFEDISRYCIDKIKDFGHQIGLHIDASKYSTQYINTILTAFRGTLPLEYIVSFHRPADDVLGKIFPYFTSVYEPRFFNEIRYSSDSCGQWREGCPCGWLDKEKYPQVQILTHPIHWGGTSSINTAKQIVANKIVDAKQYLKILHLPI